MIDVIGFSSIPLSDTQHKMLTRALNDAGDTIFPNRFRLVLRSFPEAHATANAKYLINCIALIPSSTTLEEKRRLSAALHGCVVDCLGDVNRERVTILFWNYAPDAFAAGGVLSSDHI